MPPSVLAQQSSSLLLDAVRAQNVFAVKLLLDNGADPNFSPFSDDEFKPLRLLLESRSLTQKQRSMIRLLLQTGASVELGGTALENAFVIVAKLKDQELMNFLKQYARINRVQTTTVPGIGAIDVTILDRVQTLAPLNPDLYMPILLFLILNGAQTAAQVKNVPTAVP